MLTEIVIGWLFCGFLAWSWGLILIGVGKYGFTWYDFIVAPVICFILGPIMLFMVIVDTN